MYQLSTSPCLHTASLGLAVTQVTISWPPMAFWPLLLPGWLWPRLGARRSCGCGQISQALLLGGNWVPSFNSIAAGRGCLSACFVAQRCEGRGASTSSSSLVSGRMKQPLFSLGCSSSSMPGSSSPGCKGACLWKRSQPVLFFGSAWRCGALFFPMRSLSPSGLFFPDTMAGTDLLIFGKQEAVFRGKLNLVCVCGGGTLCAGPPTILMVFNQTLGVPTAFPTD